jgi:SH3 domain protein
MIIIHSQENEKGSTLTLIGLMLAITIAVVAGSSTIVSAESLYVTPSAEVAIRSGQGTEYKIVSIVKDGSRVEFLEEEGFHTKVRLQSGKEGWMLSRFLSPDPPLDQVVERLQIENDKLKEKSATAIEKIKELNLSLKTAQEELDGLRLDREQLGQDYDTLQKDTADVVKIKEDLERTVDENSALLEKLALVEEQYNSLKKDNKMYWFLVGAGVLILGIIVGKMPGPSRRRKSSLL